LFADFSDVPAPQTPEQIFSMISPSAEKFFNDLSYGKMNWVLEPHFVWLRLSQPSAHYAEGIRSYDGHLEFIQEAVDLADADVDFSDANSVIVMVPPEASAIGYGPAFGADIGNGYTADGKVFENGVTSGADLPNWGFLWLNHETGHTMGLPDLYAYQYNSSNYDDQHRFVGGFGLMGYIDGKAPEFFAFERWQLKWLSDDQIVCQLTNDVTATLSAIETAGGSKAVVVPLSKNKVLVVESRRAVGYDKDMPKEGALVYTVDTSIASGEGTLVVYPVLENDPYRYKSPLAKGESVTVENVTVTVLDSTGEGDTIQVIVAK
jgi:M6 family metalloprotease-like protein